jgi:hypothetical protein
VIIEYADAQPKGYESPHPFYPDRGGLLPFAKTPNGDYLNWRTRGLPSKWDIVFYDFDRAQFVLLEGQGFIRMLSDILNGESPLFPERLDPASFQPPFEFTVNW